VSYEAIALLLYESIYPKTKITKTVRSFALSVLFCVISVLSSINLLYSQTARIGIHFDSSILSDSDTSQDELNWYNSIGIQIVQIDGIQPASKIAKLTDYGFRIWVGSGVAFIRSLDIRTNPQRLELNLLDPLRYYISNQIHVDRYVLASHPYIADTVLAVLTKSMQSVTVLNPDVSPTIMLTPGAHKKSEFDSANIIFVIDEVDDANDIPGSSIIYILTGSLGHTPLHSLRSLLELAIRDNHTLIFPLTYLRTIHDKWPESTAMIALYSNDPAAAFSLESQSDSLFVTNMTALLLIVGTALFLLFLTNNGSYLRSLSRYTSTHNFYVNDVVFRRIKTGSEIPISFLVTGFFLGLLLHVIADALSYELLREMIEYHAPFIFILLDSGGAAPFISGIILFGVLQLFIATWLYISLMGRLSPGQVLQLIQPPSHFIIPVSCIITVLYLNGLSGYSHIVAGIISPIFILIILLVASTDIYLNLQNNRGAFLIAGPVLFAGTLGISIWYLIAYTSLIENVSLMIQLMD
jgi:hypothetical protein